MSDPRDIWMVGDVLDAMSGSTPPEFVIRAVQEVQSWLASAVSEDFVMDPTEFNSAGERQIPIDIEYLFGQLEWLSAHADLLPSLKDGTKHEDAVILSIGPILLDEALRMMVDHAALFAHNVCKRIWLISDTWIIGDIISYMPHVRALRKQGVQLNYLFVTPWGYSQIPWTREK